MADYFTNISFILTLPDSEAQTYALELHTQAHAIYNEEEKPDTFPESLLNHAEDFWCFEVEPSDGCNLWIYSDSGGVDAICAFIQHLLKKFTPTAHIGFEWSHDCSKPRIDAYGGGAALVTAQSITSIDTTDWLQSQLTSLT